MARLLVCLCALTLGIGINSTTLAQAESPQSETKNQVAKAVKPSKITKPLWTDLKPEQHAALAPLQGEWLRMSEIQKRKWIELSKNYGKLSSDDQTKLHTRMTDWTRLSPEQRATARLNFSAAKALSSDEKQKQWEAYQALSLDEKAKLQAKAKASTPNSAALAAKPQNKVLPGKSATLAPVEK